MERFLNSEVRQEKIDKVLENKQPNLQLFLDDVHDSHNLSAILRSCDATGVLSLYYTNPSNQNLKIHKTITQGTQRWVEHTKVHNNQKIEFLKQKQKEGFQLIATHLDEKAVNFRAINYTLPTIIIMGNEKEGVSKEILAIADKTTIIPMKGMVQSLNVSVATALILYEAQTQLEENGNYDRPALSEQDRAKIKEEWIFRDTVARRSKGKIPLKPNLHS
jgi:tRNA (guanosine-2'-O-)-methyltransferase